MKESWWGGAEIIGFGGSKKDKTPKVEYTKKDSARRVSKMGKVEQGIESVVEGIITAADYIHGKGQNVQEIMVAPYARMFLSGAINYIAEVWGIIDESNTEVYDPEKIVQARLPEARSAFSPKAFDEAAKAAEDQYKENLKDLIKGPLEVREKVSNALKRVYDEASLRGIGISEAMQILSDSIGTLNVKANMQTTFRPADLYKTLEDLTYVAKSIPKPDLKLLQPLEECLKLNVFLETIRDNVTYQLSAKTASAVMLTQYNIH